MFHCGMCIVDVQAGRAEVDRVLHGRNDDGSG